MVENYTLAKSDINLGELGGHWICMSWNRYDTAGTLIFLSLEVFKLSSQWLEWIQSGVSIKQGKRILYIIKDIQASELWGLKEKEKCVAVDSIEFRWIHSLSKGKRIQLHGSNTFSITVSFLIFGAKEHMFDNFVFQNNECVGQLKVLTPESKKYKPF